MATLQKLTNFPLCLAPMVGLSHAAFRLLIREYLPEGAKTIWPTEMLNSRKLPIEDWNTTPEVYRTADETDLVPQMLGNEERFIAPSVEKLIEWGASGIDINMGCPVNKALRHNYGVALMGDSDYAADVVRMTVKHSSVPVSVKLRAGPEGDFEFLHQFVAKLVDAGASWVTLHPRTGAQKRRGRADWSQITRLKERVKIPVIGNGDIQVAEDVLRMLNETGCDQVMAGRALTARPWMFWQLGELQGLPPPKGREGRLAPQGPVEEGREYGRALLRFIELLEQHFGDNGYSLRRLKFFVRTGSVWLDYGHQLMTDISGTKDLSEAKSVVDRFFASELRMVQRTELRQ